MDQPASFQPPHPVILTSPNTASAAVEQKEKKSSRGFFATFGLLLSGWIIGNLLLVAILGLIGVLTVGSAGLVKIPALTSYLFGSANVQGESVNQLSLEIAHEKINRLSNLKKGETLDELIFTEEEVSALFSERFQSVFDYPVSNSKVSFLENEFIFTGTLKNTNAPLLVKGVISLSNLIGKVELTQVKSGKVDLPLFIGNNIVDNLLSTAGLSLSDGQFPAQEIHISEGEITLIEVVSSQP